MFSNLYSMEIVFFAIFPFHVVWISTVDVQKMLEMIVIEIDAIVSILSCDLESVIFVGTLNECASSVYGMMLNLDHISYVIWTHFEYYVDDDQVLDSLTNANAFQSDPQRLHRRPIPIGCYTNTNLLIYDKNTNMIIECLPGQTTRKTWFNLCVHLWRSPIGTIRQRKSVIWIGKHVQVVALKSFWTFISQ